MLSPFFLTWGSMENMLVLLAREKNLIYHLLKVLYNVGGIISQKDSGYSYEGGNICREFQKQMSSILYWILGSVLLLNFLLKF